MMRVSSATNTVKNGPEIKLIIEIKIDVTKHSSTGIMDLAILRSLKTRFDTWKEILKNSEKPLIGYGLQADKYLTKNLPKHTQLEANSFTCNFIFFPGHQ